MLFRSLYRLVLSALRTKFLASDMRAPLAPPPIFPWDNRGAEPAGGPDEPEAPRGAFARPAGGGVAPWFGSPEARVAGAGGAVAAAPRPAWERDEQRAAAAGDELAVQMHDRYIVVESAEGIEVIDQHALHERVLYERLKASVAGGNLEVQRLLVPERVELSAAEIELVTEHAAELEQAGMRIEPFGGSTVIVTTKPVLAGGTAAADIVREVLGRLAAAVGPSLLVDEVLHGLACRAAIKAGDPLSAAEVAALVRDRRLVRESHHCPHGRPTSLVLSRQELDRQFRRT